MILKNTTAVIVVRRAWANLAGVRWFLRRDAPQDSIGSPDQEAHALIVKILDSDDARGLFVELNTEAHKSDPNIQKFDLMIPWSFVLGIIVEQSGEGEQLRREYGFAVAQDRDSRENPRAKEGNFS